MLTKPKTWSQSRTTVSTHIVSWWKAFQELLPILTNFGIWTKVWGNVYNMHVRKVHFYGSETWPVLNGDVQKLVTADGGMIRWICGVSSKDCTPTTDLLLCLSGLSSINESALEPTEVPWTLFHGFVRIMTHGLKRLPCIMLTADNQEVLALSHIRGFVMWSMWIWSCSI